MSNVEMTTHLHPWEEDNDSSQVVEVNLKASEWLKVGVCAVVLQQEVKSVTDRWCSADVHNDGWNTELKKMNTLHTQKHKIHSLE